MKHTLIQGSGKLANTLVVHQSNERSSEFLRDALECEKLIQTIECFDISHISGSFVVASMVRFKDGAPDKSQYRRFKIRTFIGNDDFRAMEEVVFRRYKKLHDAKEAFPDLIVIDGGLGQVNAALKAFDDLGISPPVLIGLAKKRETIIFSDGKSDLNLPENSPALHLLQRVRDEAHRFANMFNAELRSKKIQESILDELEGVGEHRKKLLLKHFGNVAKLKKATQAELESIPGIGSKLAESIYNFLSRR